MRKSKTCRPMPAELHWKDQEDAEEPAVNAVEILMVLNFSDNSSILGINSGIRKGLETISS